jgi:hypothetical protein
MSYESLTLIRRLNSLVIDVKDLIIHFKNIYDIHNLGMTIE